MELTKITFKKEALDTIPERERILIAQLSIFANEISMLHKFVIFSNNIRGEGPILTAQNIQSFFVIKLLAGKIYEGWEMLRKSYFRTKLSNEYDGKLTNRGRSNLDFIKSYFGKRNLISLIRNKYIFHYDKDHILKGLSVIPSEEELDLYFAPDQGNSLYSMAHIISSYALLKEADSTDENRALDIIFNDVFTVGGKFLYISMDIVKNILSKHRITARKITNIRIRGVPLINSVTLPYFVAKQCGI